MTLVQPCNVWWTSKRRSRAIVACFLAIALALALFARGFFLTRVELKAVGECHSRGQNPSDVCNFPKRFDRAVIVLIDALRLDFVYPEALEKLHDSEEPMTRSSRLYLNKLTTLRNLVMERPSHTFLAKFDADPPTTTMQRLKGITTGGLPTFIDIKDDVASEKIFEDNLFSQLQRRNKRVTFMGDDTWTKLFPDALTKQFPFASFNVKDLDTLDQGVISHLLPEIKTPDWDVLIAHFLGVDHAGHRYGPRHTEMTRKLIEMDDVLDGLIQELDRQALQGNSSTILLVFGDHGMTEAGDHGGSTEEERSSVLFAYSPQKPLFHERRTEKKSSMNDDLPLVQQIDLAPTIAFLLDIPIPFGSLGFLVPELVGVSWDQLLQMVKANAHQIIHYLHVYSSTVDGSISLEELRKMKQDIDEVTWSEDDGSKRQAFHRLETIARKAAESARALWTQFHIPLMQFGVILGVIATISLILLILVEEGPRLVPAFISSLRKSPAGLILAWVIGVVALPSNSYIAVEENIAVFALVTGMVIDSPRRLVQFVKPNESNWFLFKMFLTGCIARGSMVFEEFVRTTGHEVPIGYGWILFAAIPLNLVWIDGLGSKSKLSLIMLGMQCVGGIAFWFLSSMGDSRSNYLAQGAYLSVVPCVGVSATFSQSVRCLFVPLSLVLGPASPGTLVGFILVARFLSLELYSLSSELSSLPTQAWKGVAIALASVLWFFYTGHSCVFGTLRITAPYVGFEEFGYWRGVIMLSLDTFVAHFIGAAISLSAGGEPALVGFLLVFATRAVMMMCHVHFARRHLMVWAIFAPKFIFDASAYAASLVFSVALLLLHRYKSRVLTIGKGKNA